MAGVWARQLLSEKEMWTYLQALFLLVCCVSAHADQVYKCKDKSGTTIYQSDPCPTDSVTVAHGAYARQPDNPQNQLEANQQAAMQNAARQQQAQNAAVELHPKLSQFS